MLEQNGNEERDDDRASEAESLEMFAARNHANPAKRRPRDEPWGGPHASLAKRLLAAFVKAAGIRVGRFPN